MVAWFGWCDCKIDEEFLQLPDKVWVRPFPYDVRHIRPGDFMEFKLGALLCCGRNVFEKHRPLLNSFDVRGRGGGGNLGQGLSFFL